MDRDISGDCWQLPVVLVNMAGRAPRRTEQGPHVCGAFIGTDLEARLKVCGVTQVVIAGVATGTGVESAARQAYEQGFNVTLAIDAMTGVRLEADDYSIRNVFPRLGEIRTSREIIDLLPARSA